MMNNTVLISVLMPVYNCEKYLREAIDSILNQTFKDFEFIIINDGSNDNSENIILEYNDNRIKLYNKDNGGVSSALNYGLQLCNAKYVARFDADDICYLNRLQDQYEFMEANPDYVLIGSDADYVDENGNFIFKLQCSGHSSDEINSNILKKNPFIHSVVFFKKDLIISLGGYDLKAHTFEDHFLWLKVIKKGLVCNFKSSYIKVRINPESVTTDERFRGKRFLQIRQKILENNDIIDNKDDVELKEIIRSQNSNISKKLGYYLFISKKYLWDNYEPKLARENLRKAIKLRPIYFLSYFLFFLSFFSKNTILKLYKSVK